MAYVMEACAENNKELIILDRPNPNGYYIDGPVMTNEYKSFLGLHNVPLVYGMTCGEYAQMVNGERWLKNNHRSIIKNKAIAKNNTSGIIMNPPFVSNSRTDNSFIGAVAAGMIEFAESTTVVAACNNIPISYIIFTKLRF